VSESRDDGQPESSSPESSSSPEASGQPRTSGQPQAGQPQSSQPRSDGPPRSSAPKSSAPKSSAPKSSAPKSSAPRSGAPRSNGQSGGSSQPAGRGQSGRGSDPVADFQRWLMKAGARSMANQVADQVKRTIGQEKRRGSGDVWDTATNEMPPNEPPECQWCPVCQAARAARVSGPGLGAKVAGASGVLASVVEGAFSAFEQAMKTQDQNHVAERATVPPPQKSAPDSGETSP
jgi:hypothetical protein